MKQNLTKLVEAYPLLQKPAYFAYIGVVSARNLSRRFAMNNLGYLPKRVSDRGAGYVGYKRSL